MQPLPPPPPPPAQNSDPAAQLLLLKQGINERFKDYRLAMLGTTNVSQIPVFKQIGAFGGYSSSVLRKVKQRARSGLRFYKGPVDLSPQAANARTKSKLDQARVLLNKEARKLWAAGLRYKRTLGAGGQGVAAVFQARNAHGETVDVVGKLVLPGTMGPGAMTDEKNLAAVFASFPAKAFLPRANTDRILGVHESTSHRPDVRLGCLLRSRPGAVSPASCSCPTSYRRHWNWADSTCPTDSPLHGGQGCGSNGPRDPRNRMWPIQGPRSDAQHGRLEGPHLSR